MVAAVGDARHYANGRSMAASLGLTPREHSSGGKQRLLGISKRGDTYLRTLLIHGARTVLRHAKHKTDRLSRWALALEARRGKNVAAVALANKLARIAWAVLARERTIGPIGWACHRPIHRLILSTTSCPRPSIAKVKKPKMAQQVRPAFCDSVPRSGPSRPSPYREPERAHPIMARADTVLIKRPDIYMQSFLTQWAIRVSLLANRVESIYTLAAPSSPGLPTFVAAAVLPLPPPSVPRTIMNVRPTLRLCHVDANKLLD